MGQPVVDDGTNDQAAQGFTFSAPITLTDEQVADLLCTAWEGGMMTSWARSEGLPYEWDRMPPGIPSSVGPLRTALPCTVFEWGDEWEGAPTRHILDRTTIQRGLELLASGKDKHGRPLPGRHLANIIGDDADAETGDVFVQLCLLGEVVYG